MPRLPKKRQIKAQEKEILNDASKSSNQSHGAGEDNQILDVESDQDDFLDKRRKTTYTINLYLQLPDEELPEVVKDFQSNFYDIQKEIDPLIQPESQLNSDLKNQNKLSVSQPTLQSCEANLCQENLSGQMRDQHRHLQGDMRMRLYDVVLFLKKQGYALENTYISYYSSVFSAYVNCNLDPVSKTIWLTQEDLELIDGKHALRLKFQKGLCRQFTENEDEGVQEVEISDSECKSNDAIVDAESNSNDERVIRTRAGVAASDHDTLMKGYTGLRKINHQEDHAAVSKMKERTIGYIIEKVAQWRRLYNGYYDQNFNHHRMSLERAADKVGVSKKSLDDYLAQLRAGRQFGYDFNANKDKKVGDLRRFVKEKLEPAPCGTQQKLIDTDQSLRGNHQFTFSKKQPNGSAQIQSKQQTSAAFPIQPSYPRQKKGDF